MYIAKAPHYPPPHPQQKLFKFSKKKKKPNHFTKKNIAVYRVLQHANAGMEQKRLFLRNLPSGNCTKAA